MRQRQRNKKRTFSGLNDSIDTSVTCIAGGLAPDDPLVGLAPAI